MFNPHYRRMQLHGSELWTTTLPAKVGLAYGMKPDSQMTSVLCVRCDMWNEWQGNEMGLTVHLNSGLQWSVEKIL